MLPNPQETADFIAFTEEILKENLVFLCSVQLPQMKVIIHGTRMLLI